MKKIALITGSNKGIGLETSRQLLDLNYSVILTARDVKRGNDAFEKLKRIYSEVYFHPMDISLIESVERCFKFVNNEFGILDVLVNNAAINYDTWHDAINADLNQCSETIDVNLFGSWRTIQTFTPLLIKSKNPRIVNVSSETGSLNTGEYGAPAYSISKAALNMLTQKTAHALNSKNVLVNAVCPGWVRTDMGGSHAPRSLDQGAKSIVWAATLEDDGPTGGFFRDGKRLNW